MHAIIIVLAIIALSALLITIYSAATSKAPWWVPTLLLSFVVTVQLALVVFK